MGVVHKPLNYWGKPSALSTLDFGVVWHWLR